MFKSSVSLKRIRLATALWRDRDGDVAILFGLMAVVLFLMIGGAVDFGRWLHARNQTIAAMDSAVLAAGRALQVKGSKTDAIAAAKAYYTQNTDGRLPLLSDTISFTVADDGLSVSAAGNAFIETPFLSLASIDKLRILAANGADYSKAEIAVGKNADTNLEIAMMLDVTGSMYGSKLDTLKDAAKDLIDIVVWDDQSSFTSRVALVPFSESVRLPSESDLTKVTGKKLPNTKTVNGYTYYISKCVAERQGSKAYTDDAAGPGQYVLGVYVPYTNGECNPGASNKLVPLTNNRSQLKSNVDQMSASGATAGHLGTAWAWYVLSSNWNKLWSSKKYDAAAYGTPDTKKIAILMTDGQYNVQYDKDGIDNWYTGASAPNGSSTNQARNLCDGMKGSGITVYTVGFGLSSGSSAEQALQYCATDASKFFKAEDEEALRQAFRAIALEISDLYLSS